MPEPTPVNVLKVGARGPVVLGWQRFLVKQKLLPAPADFIFGPKTAQATSTFQQQQGLGVDGKVGKNTLQAAVALGYDPLRDGFWPPEPDFGPLPSNKARAALFGEFPFVAAPTAREPDGIRITDDWEETNIVWVVVPQLRGVRGTNRKKGIQFHKKGLPQLLAMFQAIGDAGLADRVLRFDGSYVPRFQRGSHSSLSTHSWGSSLDLNADWNDQGTPPAGLGMRGCLLELVKIANDHGFYWGGHFPSRIDGMHFELARLD
jgi:peptidoglycan hydrolase-like protein with peptidoglycan-binding domain